ncbi:kinase-associated lipoprotein B [Staphylococcus simulans]|uniref:sporulation phosphorelay system protein KapB n=1 Tax=Staphylococcus simulans TaxID=1286 RepID=UPI000D03EB0B|nr:sporulation phosphorelay system protein KapB [Staphylococcus simulans]MCD8914324.1 kinase-associated lipoprotein B [Staphylococcus simulans]
MLYRFSHKTGTYGVSIVEEKDNGEVLVQVEQVIKHPKQGDLHNPNAVDGVFFHERRALSHYEKRFTPRSKLRDFNVETLDYVDSLQQAITDLEEQLQQQDTEHAKHSLENLNTLKKDYSVQYKKTFH